LILGRQAVSITAVGIIQVRIALRSSMTCRRLPRSTFALTILVFLICYSTHAKKLRGDVVAMKNGDHLTREVKSLDSGTLFIETEYSASNLSADSNQAVSVTSTATYLITLANGVHVTGTLQRAPVSAEHPEDVTLVGENRELLVASPNIVEMETQKPSVWRQLRGSVDAGVSFASGNRTLTTRRPNGRHQQLSARQHRTALQVAGSLQEQNGYENP
jgi:hypothetical protein